MAPGALIDAPRATERSARLHARFPCAGRASVWQATAHERQGEPRCSSATTRSTSSSRTSSGRAVLHAATRLQGGRARERRARAAGRQQSVVFGAGDVRVCVSTPLNQTSKAARYMKRTLRRDEPVVPRAGPRPHDGVPRQARRHLPRDPIEAKDERGGYRSVEIATPLGDVAFRFVERNDFRAFAPGFVDSGVGTRRAREHVRHQRHRPRDVERPHDAADHRVVPRVLGFEPFWESASTRRTWRGDRASGFGPAVDRDVGPGERREVRDERSRSARSSATRRSRISSRTTWQRRAARRVRGRRTSSGRSRSWSGAASSS